MIFGFPLNMKEYFNIAKGQFTEANQILDWPETEGNESSDVRLVETVEAGEALTLKVKEEAEDARIDYDIYVKKAEEFVVGNSPTLIIQRPYQ